MSRRWLAGVGAGWLILLTAVVSAADVELTRLLPADVAACLQMERLDEHWRAWQAHPLKQRWTGSALWPLLQQSRPWQRWQSLEAVVAAHTERKLSEHIRGVASRSLVLSLRISPEGRPQGLVLAQSLRPGAAEDLVAAWKRVEPARKFETVESDGLKYLRSSRGDDVLFLLVADDVLGMSDQESLVQDALRRLHGEAATESLHDAEWWRRVNELTSESTVMLLGIHARAWDAVLDEARRSDPEAANLAEVWKVVDRVRMEISLTHSLQWSLQADLVEGRLPERWRAVLQGFHRRTAPNFKTDAWLAIQGGFEAQPLLELLREAFSPKERDDWRRMERVAGGLGSGLELGRDLLAPLAEDYFLLVDGADEPAMPFQALLQMRWDGARPQELPQVYERLLSLGLGLVVLDANLKSPVGPVLTIRQERPSENGPSRWWLEPGILGWRPGFQVWPQALVLVTDPTAEVLQHMPQPMAVVESQPPLGGAAIAVQLNVRGFREHVQRNSAKWLAFLSQGNAEREPGIAAGWARIAPFLALLDRATVSLRAGTSEVSLHGAIEADPPRE